MIIIGRRQYVVSPRVELVAPLACGLYSALRLAMSPYFGMTASNFNFVSDVTQIASGYYGDSAQN
jgi:hypothetical protein